MRCILWKPKIVTRLSLISWKDTNNEASCYAVSPLSPYALSLRPKCLVQHHLLKHFRPILMFVPRILQNFIILVKKCIFWTNMLKIFGLYSYLHVRDQVLHPCRRRVKILVLYIFIFVYLNDERKEKSFCSEWGQAFYDFNLAGPIRFCK